MCVWGGGGGGGWEGGREGGECVTRRDRQPERT